MASVRVVCFVEDLATEEFVGAIIDRLGVNEGVSAAISFRSARGGAGTLLTRFKAFQRAHEQGLMPEGKPDLVVIARDCDCVQLARCIHEVRGAVNQGTFVEVTFATPASHVEAWYLADPASVKAIVGSDPPPPPRRCRKDAHKQRLQQAIKAGGNPVTQGGAEFGRELAQAMDLQAAAATEPTLGSFVSDLRLAFRRLSRV